MKYLKIQNNGELDIRLVSLMGGTTKSNKPELIGNFGSGLKYTIAYLLRSNLAFKIFIGAKEVKITTKREQIRGEVFDIIYVDGERTSITSNMGRDWKAWMIIRELWSNALDEGGSIRDIVYDECSGSENTTTFFIQVDNQINEVIENWEKYFIHDRNPVGISGDGKYKVYPGGGELRLYKQGVLIHCLQNQPSMFSYDYSEAELNELREYKDNVSMLVVRALACATPEVVKYFLENINDSVYEGGKTIDWDWGYLPWSDSWTSTIGKAKLITRKVIDAHNERGMPIDEMGYIVVPEPVYKALTTRFEGIGALRIAKHGGEFYEQYDSECERMINKGLAILETCNYKFHPDLDFRYGYFENKKVQAQVFLDEKIICVDIKMLQKPLSDVVAMLIEENEHFMTGFHDETREFQQHFINLYTRQLLASEAIEI